MRTLVPTGLVTSPFFPSVLVSKFSSHNGQHFTQRLITPSATPRQLSGDCGILDEARHPHAKKP